VPIYEFNCKECGHHFDLIESVSDHEQHKERCPKCNSKKLERVYSTVSVHTSKKS
jgi:putative FmdB family regulatory protein